MKFRLSDLLIFCLLFIFVVAFPVDLIPVDLIYKLVIQIGLRLLILSYYIYICIRSRINLFKFYNWKRLLLFTPFLLACFSNLIAASFKNGYPGIVTMSGTYFALLIVFRIAPSLLISKVEISEV